jgi:hypothetical protein
MTRDEKSRQNCVYLFYFSCVCLCVFMCIDSIPIQRCSRYSKNSFYYKKDDGRDEDGGDDEVGYSTSKGRSASEDDDDVEELSLERGEFAKKRVSP